MIFYTNDCVDCSLPCTYELCPFYRVMHSRCDYCNEEDVKLYNYNGDEICESCLLNEFEVVEGSEQYSML